MQSICILLYISVIAQAYLQMQSLICLCKILISYGFARFCRDECSYFTEGQEFVPRLTFKEQTGDKTLENICKCTENAVNKRKEEKIFSSFLLFTAFSVHLQMFSRVLSPVCSLKVRRGTNSCPSVKYEHSSLQNRAKPQEMSILQRHIRLCICKYAYAITLIYNNIQIDYIIPQIINNEVLFR